MANCLIIGGDAACRGGVYVLRMVVSAPQSICFGRFAGDRPISVAAGEYCYVGSALGASGATSLAGRLLRHATRSGNTPPHAIRGELATALAAAGLPAQSPTTKRLRWHIDYLLDKMGVELIGVWAQRTAEPLERRLADWLLAQPGVAPLAPGLGASDDRGRTHILRVASDEDGRAGTARRQCYNDAVINWIVAQGLQTLDQALAELRSPGAVSVRTSRAGGQSAVLSSPAMRESDEEVTQQRRARPVRTRYLSRCGQMDRYEETRS